MELYLATNYTRCPEFTSFLATKEFMTGSEHILTVICVPVNIYCFYLIWFVTPQKMEGVKLAMLHLQLVSLSFDLNMNSLMTAVAYFPAFVGSFHGLYSFLGVPHRIQVYIIQFNVYLIGMSIINIFQNRHSATNSIPYRFTRTLSLIIYYTICYLIGATLLAFYFLEDFDNDAIKLEYLKVYPCPPLEYFTSTASAITSKISLTVLCIGSACAFEVLNILYFALSIVYYLVIAPSHNVSVRTRQMQLRFLLMLTIQIGIPITALAVPIAFTFFMLFIGWNSQSISNIILFIYCSHGVISGIALIFVQKPYREHTFLFLSKARNKIASREPSILVVRTTNSN